jgi:hypothetical protein
VIYAIVTTIQIATTIHATAPNLSRGAAKDH